MDANTTRAAILEIFEQQVRDEKQPRIIGGYMIVPSSPHPFVEVRPIDEGKELPKALEGKFTDILTVTKIINNYIEGQKQ